MFPDFFTIDKLYSPEVNPIDTLIETINKFYLNKENFQKLSEKIKEELDIVIPYWRDSLEKFLKEIA